MKIFRHFSVLAILVFLLQSLSVSSQEETGQIDVCNEDISSFLPVPFNNITGLSCRPIWNNFIMRFSQTKDNVVTIILSNIYTSGWVGIGFSKDGRMLGSSAMAGWIGKEGRARIKQYYLRGTSPSEIIPDKGQLPLTNIPPAVVLNGATIYLAFQLKFENRLKQQPIILAFASKTPLHHRLSGHDDKTSINFDFSSGAPSVKSMSNPLQSIINLKRNHGILAIFGWGILLPAGAIVARYLKEKDPLWYYLHICIQFAGFIFGLAAVVAGKVLIRKIHAKIPTHESIGITVLVMSILQILAFFVRPDKDGKMRRYWNWYHHWVGRLALFLAAVNIFLGISLAGAGQSWRMSYIFIVLITLLTVIVLEVRLCIRSRRSDKPPVY
ncbi:hypothetical protein ACHQM5_011989 [Ranunculus cassubicifolius]